MYIIIIVVYIISIVYVYMQITLLWHRAVNDEGKKRLFCLVNADKLPYNVSEEVLNNLEVITQGSDGRI